MPFELRLYRHYRTRYRHLLRTDIVFGDFAAFTTQIDATFALIDETRIAVAFRAVIVATRTGESYDS